MSAPTLLFPEMGSPPKVPHRPFFMSDGCSHVIIGLKSPWSILLKPCAEGLQMKVKRRNAENHYDVVYEYTTPDIDEMAVAQLVTHAVAYIVATVLRARGIYGVVKTRVRDFTASVIVRTDNQTAAVVEVACHPRYKILRVGNQNLEHNPSDTLNVNLFLGAATFLEAIG